MTTLAPRRPPINSSDLGPLALAVADAGWFTTENLFRELRRDDVATLLLKCLDYRNAWRRGQRPWSWNRPTVPIGPHHWARELALPTGWMKRYPRLGMRPIARTVRNWQRTHVAEGRLALVMTYPQYLYLRDLVRPELSVYFNVDDYTLYWPGDAERIRELEQQAARESSLTVCTSRLRAEALRDAVPEAAGRIRHLPHGTPSTMLEEHPWERPGPPPADIAELPRPWIGYVGSLEDRVDWRLLGRLSESLPNASFLFVGRTPELGAGPWQDDCRRFLARPNVHAIGWRPQDSIHEYNRAFDVCLIPYRTDHPFNIACCPTKIMDTMGTGRPIVSTALPECRLYDHLFQVADTPEEFVAAVRSILESGSDDGRSAARHAHAQEHTCAKVADRLLGWLTA